jgi:hypothetical protein
MAEKPCTFSRRKFIKTSAAAWGFTALAPYVSSLGAIPAHTHQLSASEFCSPPLSARPMVLWAWLNGYVDRRQITRELEEMRAKGLRGPIIWDVGSIRDPKKTIPAGPPFLGDESVDLMHHALDEAARLGLEAGLFASSSWNAGGPWIGPELASKQLAWTELGVSGPASFSDVVPVPKEFDSPYELEEPYELKAPFENVALLAVPSTGPEAEGAEPVDLTGKVDETGRLSWEIPAGDWTLFRFVYAGTGQMLEIPSPASNGLIVDHMSAEATDRHFEVMLGRLFRNGKKPEALKSLMLDSFEVREAPDWTPSFVDEFHQAFGYDPRPWLPVIAGRTIHSADLSERFLHDYRVLVSRLMIRNHFARSAEILEKHDLELLAEAGHGGFPRVDTLEALGSSHIPMGEFWNGMQFWVTKEAASAAHIYGRTEVAAEALTGWRHWQDGPAEYKRLFDIAFCAGLNSGVFHTFAHNPPAAGKPGYAYHAGEHFNVNSTWWEQSGPMLEYLSRCSHLLRQGRFVADVCFYYGDQAPNLVPARRIDPKVTPPHDEGECQHCGMRLPVRIDSLGAGYDYDYVNRDIVVRDMQVRDGRLVLSSGMEYRMIVLPDRDDIALPVLRKLEQLVRDGATLVGRPPQRANSLEDYPHCDEEVRRLSQLLWGDGSSESARQHGKGRVFPEVALRDVLNGMGLRPDFSVESPAKHNLDYIHRRTENEELYFVINSADEPVEAECSFRVAKGSRPFLWNAEDGSVKPCPVYRFENGAAHLPLKLEQISSVFVVFRAGEAADYEAGLTLTTDNRRSVSAGISEPLPDIALAGPWRLEFPAGRGAPASIELDALKCWTKLEPRGARVFSGTARYTTTLHVPDAYISSGHILELDLGQVAEVAELSVNGAPTGVTWKPPYRVDVTELLRAGANCLEVKVTNVWHNRIVGDLRYPEAGEYAPTNMKWKFSADMELLRSGLLGPVVLRQKPNRG